MIMSNCYLKKSQVKNNRSVSLNKSFIVLNKLSLLAVLTFAAATFKCAKFKTMSIPIHLIWKKVRLKSFSYIWSTKHFKNKLWCIFVNFDKLYYNNYKQNRYLICLIVKSLKLYTPIHFTINSNVKVTF